MKDHPTEEQATLENFVHHSHPLNLNTLWRDSVVKISKDAVKVVKSSNNKGSKMVVTSSKNVVRIFFAFTTLTATKKAYRILPHLWKILEKSGISPLFSWLQLLLFTTFYCQTGKYWQ